MNVIFDFGPIFSAGASLILSVAFLLTERKKKRKNIEYKEELQATASKKKRLKKQWNKKKAKTDGLYIHNFSCENSKLVLKTMSNEQLMEMLEKVTTNIEMKNNLKIEELDEGGKRIFEEKNKWPQKEENEQTTIIENLKTVTEISSLLSSRLLENNEKNDLKSSEN